MAFLQTTNQDVHAEEVYPIIGNTTTLGRHPDCEIVLDHGAVSREHARIYHESGGYFVEDLHSRNGTVLNGRLIDSKVRIYDGDRLRVCDIEFSFHDDAPESKPSHSDASHSSMIGRVYLDELPHDEATFSITTQINLDKQKAKINPANAEVKLRALIDIGRNLGAATEQVIPQLLENLLKIFRQADCAYILLNDPQTKRLELRGFRNRDPNLGESLRVSRSILERVATTKTAVLSDDIGNDSRFDPSESIVNYHIHSVMAAPITGSDQDECLGVIQVDSRSGGKKFNYNDLDLLVSVAFQVAVAIENAQFHEAMIQEKIMERELSVAHRVQRGLLPVSQPPLSGYEFFDYYQPARYLGGDYYDYIPLPDGKLAVALGDVSGKGISAALLMAKLSAEVRYCLLMEDRYCDAMRRLNQTFCESRWENRFITFFLAILDPHTHVVEMYNAGHFPPLLHDPSQPTASIADTIGGLPLGVLAESEYEGFEFTLQPGQSCVLMSDGLTDAMNAAGQFFSLQGVVANLDGAKDQSVGLIGRNLVSAVRSFSGKTPQTDDQCLVLFGRKL